MAANGIVRVEGIPLHVSLTEDSSPGSIKYHKQISHKTILFRKGKPSPKDKVKVPILT